MKFSTAWRTTSRGACTGYFSKPESRQMTPLAAGLNGLQLNPPIENVARVVFAGTDQVFTRADTRCLGALGQPRLSPLEPRLNVLCAQQRQTVVQRRRAGRAGVAGDLQADIVLRRLGGDLGQPHVVEG